MTDIKMPPPPPPEEDEKPAPKPMSGFHRYCIFSGYNEETDGGGWSNFCAAFPRLDLAIGFIEQNIGLPEDGWWEIVDLFLLQVVYSSDHDGTLH